MTSRCGHCDHKIIQLAPSPFAKLAGYGQPTKQRRAAAMTTTGRSQKTSIVESSQTFPAPLVLPHDDLNYEPDCSPQSVHDWLHEPMRNRLNAEHGRDTIYIGRVPTIAKDVQFMRHWTIPATFPLAEKSPDADRFVEYLKTFYHGMNVETLKTPLQWTPWTQTNRAYRSANLPKHVALAHDSQRTRIRVRKVPDGAFAAQLNLNDIIDAAIAMLPADAYALLLLVDHDIYEDEDDDFCCGRAYGGSRVAVVQTARYNPLLDVREQIDHSHVWPLSHCKAFVDELCTVEEVIPQAATKQQIEASKAGAMRAAVDAAADNVVDLDATPDISALWFSRLARTVSHEIGHCFGMAHCVYFACSMQGTSGMKEDMRQPPYLCAICEAKLSHAIAGELKGGSDEEKQAWVRERCTALSTFCAELQGADKTLAMWQGLHAWLIARLEVLS
jgi:archaemetzincin